MVGCILHNLSTEDGSDDELYSDGALTMAECIARIHVDAADLEHDEGQDLDTDGRTSGGATNCNKRYCEYVTRLLMEDKEFAAREEMLDNVPDDWDERRMNSIAPMWYSMSPATRLK